MNDHCTKKDDECIAKKCRCAEKKSRCGEKENRFIEKTFRCIEKDGRMKGDPPHRRHAAAACRVAPFVLAATDGLRLRSVAVGLDGKLVRLDENVCRLESPAG